MPAVRPRTLVNAIMEALQQSGAAAFYVSNKLRAHPREFVVEYFGDTFSVWIYVWTLTGGGRGTLPDEFRVQLTTVNSPFAFNPRGYTALMGYHPDLRLFAGFDIVKHRSFTRGSSSVQININALHRALQVGLSFHKKSNDEVTVGIRPDQLMNYIISAELLHKYGPEVEVTSLLNKAADPTQQADISIDHLSDERQKIVSEVSRYSRNANFRKAVLNAYEHRCAVTRTQMALVDAAHILPVPVEGSSDDVSNGIALVPTLHRAYDNRLIFLDTDLVMRLNNECAEELITYGLDAGLDSFRAVLDRTIHFPIDVAQRPRPELIARANAYRRIPGYR